MGKLNDQGITPLHIAICEKNGEKIENLLDAKADVNQPDSNGNTPLHLAIQTGDLSIAKLLIESGAKLNLSNIRGFTPLALAAQKGRTAEVKLLVENGALVNVVDINGNTPLMLACIAEESTGNLSGLFKYLLSKGADCNRLNINNQSARDLGALYKNSAFLPLILQIDELLENSELPVSLTLSQINTHEDPISTYQSLDQRLMQLKIHELLFVGVESGNINDVRTLLEYGADPNKPRRDAVTPLHIAVYKNDLALVNELVKYKADLHLGCMGRTAFHIAVENGFTAIAKQLFSSGAYMNTVDIYGNTPLMAACKTLSKSNNHIELFRYLLNNGADVSVKNREGNTAEEIARLCENYSFDCAVEIIHNQHNIKQSPGSYGLFQTSNPPTGDGDAAEKTEDNGLSLPPPCKKMKF